MVGNRSLSQPGGDPATTEPRPVAAALPFEAIANWLHECLSGRDPRRGVILTVPAPRAEAEALWRCPPASDALLWHAPGGPVFAGIGKAAVLIAGGERRFADLERAIELLWQRFDHVVHPEATAFVPALLGGLAFAPGSADSGDWSGFGDTRWVLPRLTYQVTPTRATLALALAPEDLASGRAFDIAQFATTWGALAAAPRPRQALPPLAAALHEPPPSEWAALVESGRREIAAGRLRKVVLARASAIELVAEPDHATLLAALADDVDQLYRFGFRVAGTVFLGASPELLVARRGLEVESEALAASLPRAPTGSLEADRAHAAELLADPKQREEHQIVVDAVRAALGPLCADLEAPSSPQVRFLKRIVHLSTPFSGRLRQPASLLALAAALHPTPAVGGEPTAAATQWITGHEPAPRGWFSGPIGRIDRHGNGELAVALRCALSTGRTLRVFAGAGIVAASDPAAEHAETRLKVTSTLAALGIQS